MPPSPSHPPIVLLLLNGHPAAGKSSFARAVAAALPPSIAFTALDKDDFRPHDVADAVAANDAAYDGVAARLAAVTAERRAGPPTIILVDSPLSSRARWDAFQAAAGPHAVPILIEVACSDARAWRARLEARAAADAGTPAAHKPASWDELQALIASYAGRDAWPESTSPPPWRARFSVDTAQEPLAAAAARVVGELRQRGWLSDREVE